MRSFSLAILLAATLIPMGCGGGGSDTAAPVNASAEPAPLAGITAAHDQVRARVGVAPLVWNAALAATAQAWADAGTDIQAPTGLLDNNPNRSNGFAYAVGENIFGSSGPITASDAVASWATEATRYDHATNTCSGGGGCSRYTQLVWAASRDFGCGIAHRTMLTFGHTIVCNYGPAGNTGGRPY